MRRFVLALAACGTRADHRPVTVDGTTVTYADDAPAQEVLDAIARVGAEPMEIRDKDGLVCRRGRRPPQPKQDQVVLSVRISATEWITRLTRVDEENLIDPPFDRFAQIVDVYHRSPLGITDAQLAAQPGTLAATLTPALRTLCAAFPALAAVRPDALAAKPAFGDANTQPPAPRDNPLLVGEPTVDGPMSPAIVRQFLVHDAALLAACKTSATLAFAIDTDGHATGVADPCLASAVAAIHFPAPPARVTVTAPLAYRPAAPP